MLNASLILLLTGAIVLASGTPGQCALKSASKAAQDPAAAYNPNPDKEGRDFELPMPNGQKMVLRAVPIDSGGLWGDETFEMGLVNLKEERAIYERRMPAHIGAPFLQMDMPKEWKPKFSAEENKPQNQYTYYLIGKYELTNGQWAAVMGEELEGRPDLPKTDISWYDVQDFLRKYNEWLMQNHPDKLPVVSGLPAFLRLPTEPEWEYAPRAPKLNAKEQQRNKDFPGLGEKDQVENYAIYGMKYEDKMPIGTRMPNKLGIYDMAGNAGGEGSGRLSISKSG